MNSKKTILHIITGLGDGGAEAVLYRLCSFSSQFDHVVVSLSSIGKYGPALKKKGLRVYALDMSRGKLKLLGLYQLFRLIKKTNPIVVQTWMYHSDLIGGLVGRLAGNKNVVWGIRNSTLANTASNLKTKFVRRILGVLSFWIPRKIIICAENAIPTHRKVGYDTKNMIVIPNGYDLKHFLPDGKKGEKVRSSIGITDDIFLIGLVARFDPQKDHLNFFKALQMLKDRKLKIFSLLVGTGMDDQNKSLATLIQACHVNSFCRLMGPREDIESIYNACDILVSSSSSGEAFPNVLAESMACGVPCVTTDVGDASIIVGQLGWVVPRKDPCALAEGIAAALTEKELYPKKWSQRKTMVREHIEKNFSVEKMVNNYHRVWDTLY